MGARVLVIDNYDSFVYNLVQYLGELGAEPVVHRNDALDPRRARRARARRRARLARARAAPRTPASRNDVDPRTSPAGVPVLGVCLGHQCIGQVFGGEVVRAPQVMHGKTSLIRHDGAACSPACPTRSRPPATTRSWSTAASVPDVLEITAETDDGIVMGLRHRELRRRGRAVPPRVDPHRRPATTCSRNFLGHAAAPGPLAADSA